VAVAERELQVLALQRGAVISSFFSKPLVTPATRLATCARAVPYIACARLVLTLGATLTAPFSNFTSTSSWTTN
jgi:hypothetical protein